MFHRGSESGRNLVPSTDETPANDDRDGPQGITHHLQEPQHRHILINEPIYVDNHQQFTISDGEESFEVEEDIAHTVTDIYRQRRKQQKKAALRVLIIASACLFSVAAGLAIYYSVRAKQVSAYSSTSNTNENPQTTSSSKPEPYTRPLVPLPHSKVHGRTRSPAISPYHIVSATTDIPQNITADILHAPGADLKAICSTDAQNQDLTKCEAECSKGRCCWATNTCTDNTLCTAYSPCFILTLSATNNTNSYVGGCASEVSDMYPSSFECYPIFLPCNTDMDCEGQMLNLGVFVNCTSECSESQYSTPSDNKNEMNISDTISQIGNLNLAIKNTTNSAENYHENTTLIWSRITFDDFESGWGNFKDAGSDSKLVNLTLNNDDVENHLARIRDNSKESVLPLRESRDVSKYKALCVEFMLVADGLEPGDTMLLEYSSDGGWNWEIVKEWIFGDDPKFHENKVPYHFNVTFYSTDYDFSVAAMIRFRSDANSDSDNFYIDNVEFLGGKESVIGSSGKGENLPPNTLNASTTTENGNTTWNLITFDDFESGWGNFRDGGADSKLIALDSGNHVARIRDDRKESILPLKYPKNITQYRALRVNFLLLAEELESGDMMLLEYSPDGGSSWEIVKQWIFGKDLLENGIPYNFNVTFYSTDYIFSGYAMIRFRSDANSNADHFYIDNVKVEGSGRIDDDGSNVMASNFFSYCGSRNETNGGIVTCNPANIPCKQDLDCFTQILNMINASATKCGEDKDCLIRQHAQMPSIQDVRCLTECDQSSAAVSQNWETITSDDFENGYGNFVDKGSDSKITAFIDDKNVTSMMVQLKNGKGVNSSLPLRDYFDVRNYVALRVSVLLVFQGIESGDTLLLEYSPEPTSWVIVEEWVFGGQVLNRNNVPYMQEAIFYNSAYTNFTDKARIRFRSLGNSNNDHFLIDNVVFSGLKK